MTPSINAHIHLPPNYSAFTSVDQAITLATEQGITVLGASNYYDWSVYEAFAQKATAHGIFPLFGLEVICLVPELQAQNVKINDPGNPGKFYLCGKGLTKFSPLSDDAEALLSTIRRSDSERMAQVVTKLSDLLGASLTAEQLKTELAQRHGCDVETVYLQERHVAQAFADTLGLDPNAVRSQWMKAGKPGYVEETFVGFDHAYRLILALGGIPCYPTLADGTSPICGFEEPVESLIAALKNQGIYAAEVIPTRNTPEVLTRYVTEMREAGLIVTAGTEHNTPALDPLVPTCLGGTPIPEALQAIFTEGATVIAAHQSGPERYVDTQGQLCAGYSSTETRIAAFAERGAAILANVNVQGATD
jgi:hypothetical protein